MAVYVVLITVSPVPAYDHVVLILITGTAFNPSFPGTCPYITTVGATQIKPNATITQPEEAAESVSE